MALFGTLETLKLQVVIQSLTEAFLYIKNYKINSSEYKSISNTKVDECNKIVLDENALLSNLILQKIKRIACLNLIKSILILDIC